MILAKVSYQSNDMISFLSKEMNYNTWLLGRTTTDILGRKKDQDNMVSNVQVEKGNIILHTNKNNLERIISIFMFLIFN